VESLVDHLSAVSWVRFPWDDIPENYHCTAPGSLDTRLR
jgi:hypothetical protein